MFRHLYYGWVIVGVGWMALFASAATAPPVFTLFITPMGQELGWSRTLMAGAVSLGTIANVPLLPIVGRWLDRYGARMVVTVAGTVVGGALFSLAGVHQIWGFYIGYGIGRLLDQGVVNIACTTAVSNWFIRKRGRAQAITNVGRALGSTIMPLIVFFFIRTYGWRSAWLVLGITVWLVMVIPAATFLKRRPEDIGLRPDGLSPDEEPPAATAAAPTHKAGAEPEWGVHETMRTPALWLVTAAIFIRGVAAPGVAIHLMPFMLDRGLDPAVAAVAVSLTAASIGAGGMIGGLLAERWRVGYLLSATMAVLAASMAVLLLTHSPPLAFAYAILSGMGLGSAFTLEVVIWADYYGRMSLGRVQGFTMPFVFVGTALGPVVAGLSYDVGGSYQAAFVAFALGYVAAAAMLAAARPPRRQATSPQG